MKGGMPCGTVWSGHSLERAKVSEFGMVSRRNEGKKTSYSPPQ